MGPVETLFAGIAPDHWIAVFALLALPPALLGLRWLRPHLAADGRISQPLGRWAAASFERRVLSSLLLVTAVVHLALPAGHHDNAILTLLFLASGAAFAIEAVQSLGEGRWRARTAVLLIGSIAAYLVVAAFGWREEVDQVGIATKLVELAALALVVIPAHSTERVSPGIRSRLKRPAASAGVVALTFATGAVIWAGMFVSHNAVDASQAGVDEPGTPVHAHDEGAHHHDFAARAQAGLIVRPASGEPPTLEETEAANRLAEETLIASGRFSDYDTALASGYVEESLQLGVKRHLTNKAYQRDGRVLDPERPEQLVFAGVGEHRRLLGVVYQVETAGEPGPEIGGPITNWHAHNICLSVLPPAFGIVSPFGSCALGAVALTTSEMMHVWVVDNPGGPFADDLDDAWVRKLGANGD